MFESIGISGATTTAVAAATFGIVVAGLVAGWTGAVLIRRLSPSERRVTENAQDQDITRRRGAHDSTRKRATLLTHVLLISFAMGTGSVLSPGLKQAGMVLPGFVGPMLTAVILR